MVKLQSALKSYVQSQGKLMTNWDNYCTSLVSIISNINELKKLIRNVHIYNSKCLSNPGKNDIQVKMIDVRPHLLSKLYGEIESLRTELEKFWKGLSNVMVAMQKLYTDIFNSITNESVTVFKSGDIFTTDHIIDIYTLIQQYLIEFDRKQQLITYLLYEDYNSRSNNYHHGNTDMEVDSDSQLHIYMKSSSFSSSSFSTSNTSTLSTTLPHITNTIESSSMNYDLSYYLNEWSDQSDSCHIDPLLG